MRLASTFLTMCATVSAAQADPVRLDCKREVLGDSVVLYVDVERRTMHVESDFFGIRDRRDLKIDMVSPRKITAVSGPPGRRVGHVIDRQSGVYTQIVMIGDKETKGVFICRKGEPVL